MTDQAHRIFEWAFAVLWYQRKAANDTPNAAWIATGKGRAFRMRFKFPHFGQSPSLESSIIALPVTSTSRGLESEGLDEVMQS